ncbi:alpha/beta fold hydrolase [Nocardia sp. 2YAB30]|uniref:alpha/beta fold hydrolase n=1 Tax=unclassified Nocardia TaxID=2637762 RepID=UPI003F9546DC
MLTQSTVLPNLTIQAAFRCSISPTVSTASVSGSAPRSATSALEGLSTLKTPARLLLGEYDRAIPKRYYVRRFLRELPATADRILMHGVGHVPMLEAPDRIATLIAEHVSASRAISARCESMQN